LAFFAGFGASRRGVLHQPLAPGPRGAFFGVWKSWPRGGPGRPFLGLLGLKSPKSGIWASGALLGPPDLPGPPGYRGAPARGVDVKPPSRGPPGPAPGLPGALWASRTPPGVQGTSRRPLRAPPGGLGPLPRGLGAGVLHQPLAPGPRGSREEGPGTGVPGRGLWSRRGYPPGRGRGRSPLRDRSA